VNACLARVQGRVQGVGYRAAAAGEARRRGLRGWVRNRADGSVELLAVGPQEQVDALLDWCRRGPPGARVTALDAADVPLPPDLGSFSVLPTL
jgi:acylphosphatase